MACRLSQCEYWSDTLDRWAEDLVEAAPLAHARAARRPACRRPSCWKCCKFSKAKSTCGKILASPSKPKPAQEIDKWHAGADDLSGTQKRLDERVKKVIDRIRELPDAATQFGKEIALLAKVDTVMDEATDILARPETGSPAIAAETEAIELLLQSKRINPKSGGGGGATPGGGGGGDTKDSRWQCWAAASTRKKSGKTTAFPKRWVSRAPCCPKNSAPD